MVVLAYHTHSAAQGPVPCKWQVKVYTPASLNINYVIVDSLKEADA